MTPKLGPGPCVSVVMSVYNGERYLREALDGILSQTYSDFEFVVINDGSTDGTRTILASYTDSRLRIVHQENKGLTRALNKGINLSNGEFIARQDADDISEPSRLEKQIKFLEDRPSCALVGCWSKVIDDKGELIGTCHLLTEPMEVANRLPIENQFVHGAIMVRRSAAKEIGGYREAFLYAQDYDFVFRLSERYAVANIDEELYRHRKGEWQASITSNGLQEAYANLARQLYRQRREEGRDALDAGVKAETLLVEGEGREAMYCQKHIVYMALRHDNMKMARKVISAILRRDPLQWKPYFQYLLTLLGAQLTPKLLGLWSSVRYRRHP